jgi:hypothetical protein
MKKRSKVVMDIPALCGVANYAHWIPITQGLHKEHFRENFPGWQWNSFIPRLLEMKVIVFASKDPSFVHLGQGLYISGDVEFVEFIPGDKKVEVKIINKTTDL